MGWHSSVSNKPLLAAGGSFKWSFHLLDPLHDLLLGGVAGQPLVEVGHHVHAYVAGEVPGLGRSLGGHGGGEEQDSEERLHLG